MPLPDREPEPDLRQVSAHLSAFCLRPRHHADVGTDSGDGAAALKSLRLRAGLSQQRLADRSGVTSRTIRSLEHGAITNPHASTLIALSAALDLDTAQVDELVRAFDGSRAARSFSDVLASDVHASLDQAIHEGRLRSLLDLRNISTSRILVVGANRRFLSLTYHHVSEALRAGTLSRLHGDSGEAGIDVRLMRTVDMVGCDIAAEVVDPERNVRIVEFSSGRPLRKGEQITSSFRNDFGNETAPEDPALAEAWHRLRPDTRYTTSFVHPVGFLSIAVRFLGEPPRGVWAISGPPEQYHRDHELPIDSYHSVGATWRSEPAGAYGIEWEWPDDD